jgi:hypothetical protein
MGLPGNPEIPNVHIGSGFIPVKSGQIGPPPRMRKLAARNVLMPFVTHNFLEDMALVLCVAALATVIRHRGYRTGFRDRPGVQLTPAGEACSHRRIGSPDPGGLDDLAGLSGGTLDGLDAVGEPGGRRDRVDIRRRHRGQGLRRGAGGFQGARTGLRRGAVRSAQRENTFADPSPSLPSHWPIADD